VESKWVHSALRPPVGLLCPPRVIMMMEKVPLRALGSDESITIYTANKGSMTVELLKFSIIKWKPYWVVQSTGWLQQIRLPELKDKWLPIQTKQDSHRTCEETRFTCIDSTQILWSTKDPQTGFATKTYCKLHRQTHVRTAKIFHRFGLLFSRAVREKIGS
jgi:hypothetical protein